MSDSLTITMVVDTYCTTTNGTTITAMRMTEALREKGHTVYVLTGSDCDEKDIYTTGHNKLPIVYQLTKSQGMLLAKSNKSIIQDAIKKSDIVHFLLPFKLCKEGKKIADKLNVPSTAAFHVQPENITSTFYLNSVQTLNKLLYSSFRKFYNQFTHVHCPSKMIANALKKHGYKSKLHVISNGVAKEFYPKTVEKPQELKDKFVILMIGRLSREKRQDLIIKAIKELEVERDIQLIFAGKGPWKKSLIKASIGLTNQPIMKFYSQSELIDVINYADLYIHASDYEIEAISCIEAFSCGLVPIISNNQNSATNQFALSTNNVFEAGNHVSLASKIATLYKNKDLRDSLSKEYIEYAKQYQLDYSITKMEEMFYEVLNNQPVKERN